MAMPRIAIIGGGPSGLTLANVLRQNNIAFEVFERDNSPEERSQGGTLDLHPESGQAAIRAAGLWDEFVKHARPESDVLKLVRQDGTIVWDENTQIKPPTEEDKYNHRPEIDRKILRQILLDALDERSVHFGKTLADVVPGSTENTWDLHFRDGSVETGFDLVVGAEGTWSRVRTALSDIQPYYSTITAIELWALDAQKRTPWMIDFVGGGSMFSPGQDRQLMSQRCGDGSIRSYACLRRPENFLEECGIDWTDHDTARKQLVERYYSDCADEIKRMILESSDQLIPRKLFQLPVDMKWEHRQGLTLLGDAAHLMTLFAGVGVNAAMQDALELGKALTAVRDGLMTFDEAVRHYESELFPRGQQYAERTMNGIDRHFSADGCERTMRLWQSSHQSAQN